MKITEQQLGMLAEYYNASDPFLERKEVSVDADGVKVLAIDAKYHPAENQHMPEEVWQSLELWHMRHMIQVKQWIGADDLPF